MASKTKESYTIAWICALEVEQAAAQGMLDVEHPQLPSTKGDTNSYRFGNIGGHDVVIAVLKSGIPGTSSAAVAATNLLRSFPNIRFGLMVGVGGGAATKPNNDAKKDIRLGDVVVSNPTGKYGGVVQYDFGKSLQSGKFVLTGSLNSPPAVLGTAVAGLRGDARLKGYQIRPLLDKLCAEYPDAEFEYPGAAADVLFASENVHLAGEEDCSECGSALQRKQRSKPEIPMVHYGLIGSANQVLRDSLHRDRLHQEMGIICFEMEAAGLMQDFPCLVVRGICDYCDSHKNKQWQPYAAATAAAFTKRLLLTIPPQQVMEQELARAVIEKLDGLVPVIEDIHNATSRMEDKLVFDGLPEADRAAFDSFDFPSGSEQTDFTCLKGTRVDLLKQIREWISSLDGKTMFWLSGAPGTGKSTISRTVAQEFSDLEQLGASFFFKRNQGDRGNASRFFTTIAAQLARRFTFIRPKLAETLQAYPRIAEKGIMEQFERLVFSPMSKYSGESKSPILLVIDALDECDGDRDVRLIIDLLSRIETIENMNLRILLTSRPELPIELGFKKVSSTSYDNLILQDLPEHVTRLDILQYLGEKFCEIQIENSYLPSGWPGKDSLEVLAEMASPLFIFAATVYRFVGGSSSDPEYELSIILKHRNESLDQINNIYVPILQRLAKTPTIQPEKWIADFRSIIGCIVVAFEALSVDTLATFLEIAPQYISNRLKSLQSVLKVPSDLLSPVTLHHLSFANFLLDGRRQHEHDYWINAQERHKFMAMKCLNLLLNTGCLKQDICDLKRPGYLRKDINQNLINICLPPSVQYACRYWTRHLVASQFWDAQFQEQIQTFLASRFLFWFEALSLLGRSSELITMISHITGWHGTYIPIWDTTAMLADARRFAMKNAYIADIAPLQLYSSCMMFAPLQTFVRRTWTAATWIQSLPRVPREWDTVVQTLQGRGGEVVAMSYLPNNNLLVSLAEDETIRFWDSRTGTLQHTVWTEIEYVCCLSHSPSEELLAVGSESGMIGIFDVPHGRRLQTFTIGDVISNIAFSPDGKYLAASSENGILRLWGLGVKSLHSERTFKLREIFSLAFSPDGEIMAFCSSDNFTLELWSVSPLQILWSEEFPDKIIEVTFLASSGSLVIRLTRSIQLWKVLFAEMQLGCVSRGRIEDMQTTALSPDGGQLAIGTTRGILIFSTVSETLVEQHSIDAEESSTSLVYVSDDGLLASATPHGLIRILNTNLARDQTHGGLHEKVNRLAITSDGELLISTSPQEVKIWNVASEQLLKRYNVSEYMYAAHGTLPPALASNNELLAFCRYRDDAIIYVFSMTSGKLLQKLHHDDINDRDLDRLVFSSGSNFLLLYSVPRLLSNGADRSITKYQLWDMTSWKIERIVYLPGSCNGMTACSSDSKFLARLHDRKLEIWDLMSRERRSVIHFAETVNWIRFNEEVPQLETNLAIFQIQDGRVMSFQRAENDDFNMQGSWIVTRGQRLLWLPPEHRSAFASRRDVIALGAYDGAISIFKLSSLEIERAGVLQENQEDTVLSILTGEEAAMTNDELMTLRG